MKAILFFLIHILTFVCLASAMDDPMDLGPLQANLQIHRKAIKEALEPDLSQHPQHIKETCHHLIDTLVTLQMGVADCRQLIVEGILNERRVSLTGGELHINIAERYQAICDSATIIAENAADLFLPRFPLNEQIEMRLSLLEISPVSLQFGLAVAREFITDKMNPQERAEILSYVPRPDFSYMQMMRERGPTLRRHKNNLFEGLKPLGSYPFFFLVSTLEEPCIEALSAHAQAFFYNGKMGIFDRTDIVDILGKQYQNGFLTADEISTLGEMTKCLVEDVKRKNFPDRLANIIQIICGREDSTYQ